MVLANVVFHETFNDFSPCSLGKYTTGNNNIFFFFCKVSNKEKLPYLFL